mmetsp:Transcript_16413/g.40147  ORF Transcript_16413/g.40147 Transcript_16413/m.40147 type:complete len:205 (+) Transcript_16413:374-988(+)
MCAFLRRVHSSDRIQYSMGSVHGGPSTSSSSTSPSSTPPPPSPSWVMSDVSPLALAASSSWFVSSSRASSACSRWWDGGRRPWQWPWWYSSPRGGVGQSSPFLLPLVSFALTDAEVAAVTMSPSSCASLREAACRALPLPMMVSSPTPCPRKRRKRVKSRFVHKKVEKNKKPTLAMLRRLALAVSRSTSGRRRSLRVPPGVARV